MGAYHRAADPAGASPAAAKRRVAIRERDQRRDDRQESTFSAARAAASRRERCGPPEGFAVLPRSTVHDYLGLWNWDRHAGSASASCALCRPQVLPSILYDKPRASEAELRSHYLFEDRFGRPGKGNDKGKVEGIPAGRPMQGSGTSMINTHLEACCAKRWADSHDQTVGEWNGIERLPAALTSARGGLALSITPPRFGFAMPAMSTRC